MRRTILLACLAALGLCAAGCGKEQNTRQILVHSDMGGRMRLAMAGSPERLMESNKIDMHEKIKVPSGLLDEKTGEPTNVLIDTWVIKARSGKGGAAAPARATVLILHDLGDSKAKFLGLGQTLADRGYDVILPDLRAHGDSTGKYVTYGAWERSDAKNVVDELVAKGAVNPNIYVVGHGLGGATALQYAAIECAPGADRKVKGVIAIAPFKDARTQCRRYLKLIPEKDFEEALAAAAETANFTPEDTSSVKAVAVLRNCPILLIHGKLDTTVPLSDSEAIYAAATGHKRLETVAFADHNSILLLRGDNWLADRVDELVGVAQKAGSGATRPKAPTTRPAPGKADDVPKTPAAPAPKAPSPLVPIMPPSSPKAPGPVGPAPKAPEPVEPIMPPSPKTPEPSEPILPGPPKAPEPIVPTPPPSTPKAPEPVTPTPPTPPAPTPPAPTPPATTPPAPTPPAPTPSEPIEWKVPKPVPPETTTPEPPAKTDVLPVVPPAKAAPPGTPEPLPPPPTDVPPPPPAEPPAKEPAPTVTP